MRRNQLGLIASPFFCVQFCFAILSATLAFAPAAFAQVAVGHAQPQITQPVSEGNLVVLSGNTRPEARNTANDRGKVADTMPMQHMLLQLRRPAAQEQALATLIDQLHDPKSPNYQHWLTAAEFGAQFAPAASDIAAVTGWLAQRGFTVNTVYPSGMVIDYSGTAGQVGAAFHTEIHNINVKGVTRYANVTDPQIPAALAPAVVGVVSLHNIPPKAMYKPKSVQRPSKPHSEYTADSQYNLVPADLATIYNFNPVFTGGNSGQGQSIYLIEDTDLYTNADWTAFRLAFGLSGYTGASLTTVHPAPTSSPTNCTDPGANGDDGEAILDAEWASAAAPSAAIVMATCANTATFGGLIALQNLINGASPPAIISMSYGECETYNGATANQAYSSIFQQGVTGGTSIFVSSGDSAAAGCDDGNEVALYGITVSGFASTPYNVAVGGTDYSDQYSNTLNTYWNSTNSTYDGSAKSYIPEIPWNDSCASVLLATYEHYTQTYGSSGFCNSSQGSNFWDTIGGSGGPSGCATGTPSNSPVVSGTCAGWPKPSWQSGFIGIHSDGVRDLPDVSLFASNGFWSHSYIYCLTDPANGGVASCAGDPNTWGLAGGTSFSSPIWAGIQALINKKAGGKQGLPNYKYYSLAATEYGASGSTACNSSKGNTVGSSCIFYDVTLGDMDLPCFATYNCYSYVSRPQQVGVLSTSTSAYQPAYGTTTGWDFATGIGTVNVANLVNNWSGSSEPVLADTHDFNGDTKSDVLFRNGNTIGMWLMNASAVLSSGSVATVTSAYSVVGARDFNGDGKADLLWHDTSGNVYMWFMNGLAMSSSATVGNVPNIWSIKGTGDMNGDGKGDILWQDSSGDLAIWFMNAGTVSSSASIGTVAPSTNWTILGDTTGGILWQNTATGALAVWKVNNTTVTSSALGSVSSNWVVQGIGDFNDDGIPDILFRDSTSGTVAIWFLNSSGAVGSSASVAAVSPAAGWTILQTGDFNGDGKSDILWTDGSGNLAIWFMNSATISSSSGIGNTGGWTVQTMNSE